MVIIYGSGGNRIDLGRFSTEHCADCQKARPHKLILDYKYEHLYWCKTVTEKQYYLFCAFCQGSAWNMETADVESRLGGSPIPFTTRYGLVMLICTILLVVVSVIVLHNIFF